LLQNTQPRVKPSTSTNFATRSSNGRASSSAVPGQTTIRRSPGPFTLSRRPTDYQRCGAITIRCETCISQSPPTSTTCLQHWQTSNVALTKPEVDSSAFANGEGNCHRFL